MNRTTLKEMNTNILCFQVSGNHLSEVNTNVKFELDLAKEIGRGGTCLVYHAYKILNYNGEELRHKVILKEFFPKLDGEDKILREKDGSLIIPNAIKEQALYKRKLQRFLHSYEMFVNLHNEEKTNNYIVDAYEMIEANGTWYIIADYNEAITLENYIEKQPNLYEFCQIMRNVSQAMSCFHDLEYLHLDLTPGNIMVFKDLSVRIMDTDSLLKKDELLTEVPGLSFSDGYGAPELLKKRAYQNLGMWGERSDIFSFGVIFYRYLFGKRLEILTEQGELDQAKMKSLLIEFSYETDLQEKIEEKYEAGQKAVLYCPRNAIRKIQEFLRLLLQENMFCRYGDMKEVTKELEEILPLVNPKEIPYEKLGYYKDAVKLLEGAKSYIEDREDYYAYLKNEMELQAEAYARVKVAEFSVRYGWETEEIE